MNGSRRAIDFDTRGENSTTELWKQRETAKDAWPQEAAESASLLLMIVFFLVLQFRCGTRRNQPVLLLRFRENV
jgi:hypothetical protein